MSGISVPGLPVIPNYWIRVAVYENDSALHSAMRRHRNEQGYSVPQGVGASFAYPENSGHGRYVGILRVSREGLTVNTVIHESVHVAVQVARVYYGVDELRLSAKGRGLREELVAYVAAPLAETLIERFFNE